MKAIIERDQWAESPRTAFDNLSTFIFLGKHSNLGDKHDLHGDFGSFKGHEKAIRKAYDVAVLMPVYAYIHSGMTISTEPFSCPWDSGQLGFAIVTKQAIRENFGTREFLRDTLRQQKNVLWPRSRSWTSISVETCTAFPYTMEMSTLTDAQGTTTSSKQRVRYLIT